MKRILIVDDDAEILKSLAMLLRDKYEVATASDGVGALEKLKTMEYDLIILDSVMPRLDGAGLVHALEESGIQAKILMMSASTNISQHARSLSVADHLGKPFHIDELEGKIERIIGTEHASDAGDEEVAPGKGLPDFQDLTKKHLVVFLDDEPEIVDSVNMLLAEEPYDVLTTTRPAQALQWLHEKAVSLLISDQVMPENLGTDFLEQVRARSPATLCAIVTAYPEGAKLLRTLSQVKLSIIPKPLDVADLKRTIRKLLHNLEKA